MWAPDAAEKDGKYYLYFPVKDKESTFRIGVAVGDAPEGPFKAQPEAIKNSFSMDPAVFKDDDGKYYMYFGGLWGGQLQHWKTGKHTPQDDSQPADDKPALLPKVARMADDMLEFAEKPKDVKIVDENGKPLLSGDHDRRFFEASWVHKYKGNYYFSYSTGDSHFIAYGMGKSPYGPFTYKGAILMPVLGWTNHHSIVEVDGKTYLFYHDTQLSNGVNHLRNVKQPIELTYNEDGTIKPVDAYFGDSIAADAHAKWVAEPGSPHLRACRSGACQLKWRRRSIAKGDASASPFLFGGTQLRLSSRPHERLPRIGTRVAVADPAAPHFPRAAVWLLAMAGVFMLAMAFAYWNSATTTTIVLVRHAEKQVGAISDAPLSPEGEVRASAARADVRRQRRIRPHRQDLRDRHPPHPADRRGLAQRLGLKPEIVDAKTDSTELARRALRENRGGRALIVGHSNTVPEIVAALAHADNVPPMGEDEFDTLYVVTVPTIGKASVLRTEVLTPSDGVFAQLDGLPDERLVFGDREVRLHPAANHAVLVHQERDPLHPEAQRPVDPEHLDDFFRLIRQQREGQAVLLAKALVALRALRADARHRQAGAADFPVNIADRAGFARATRREIRRVEEEDGGAVLEHGRQRNVVAVLVREGELGHFAAGVKHGPDIKSDSLARGQLPKCPRIPRLPDPPSGWVFNVWGGSSDGRASRSQCEGRGFDPLPLHQKPFTALH